MNVWMVATVALGAVCLYREVRWRRELFWVLLHYAETLGRLEEFDYAREDDEFASTEEFLKQLSRLRPSLAARLRERLSRPE